MHAFIFYTIMMNSWLTELAHHEASVGCHKTVIIAGAKQVTIYNVAVQLVNDRFKLWEGLPAVIIT